MSYGQCALGSNSPRLGTGRGHCVVLLAKKFFSLSVSLHPGV